MGLGFLFTVVLLSAMLGLFAKYALSADQQPTDSEANPLEHAIEIQESQTQAVSVESEQPVEHPHAM
ncbi:hypothetical protein [Alicyclobacillus fodiniaquatilis]|uniref:Uncharacterized protein n=1 Tax=Alicyclobacillus fodiniaquatilis TaxID=1661150 RepID=A0ABW4JCP1_9BACL